MSYGIRPRFYREFDQCKWNAIPKVLAKVLGHMSPKCQVTCAKVLGHMSPKCQVTCAKVLGHMSPKCQVTCPQSAGSHAPKVLGHMPPKCQVTCPPKDQATRSTMTVVLHFTCLSGHPIIHHVLVVFTLSGSLAHHCHSCYSYHVAMV